MIPYRAAEGRCQATVSTIPKWGAGWLVINRRSVSGPGSTTTTSLSRWSRSAPLMASMSPAKAPSRPAGGSACSIALITPRVAMAPSTTRMPRRMARAAVAAATSSGPWTSCR